MGVMAVVAAGFFLVLKIGFILHHDPLPAPFSSRGLTGLSAIVLAAGAAKASILAAKAMGRRPNYRDRHNLKHEMSEREIARRQRAVLLAADPTRAKYAPLVERGEEWSDEDIAYAESPSATNSCSHLQLVERTMRHRGIEARRYKTRDIVAKCRIDFPALQSSFEVVPPVRYAEFYQGDRYEFEHPTAFLICDEHNSIIHTVHPEDAGATNLPLFPPPSAS
jgi:hypothetical protein